MSDGRLGETLRAGSVRLGQLAGQVAQIGGDLRRRLAGLGTPPASSGVAVGAAATTAAGRLAGAGELADILAGIAAVLGRLAADLDAGAEARRRAVRLAAEHGFVLGAGGAAVPGVSFGGAGRLPASATAAGRILADGPAAYARAAEAGWAAAVESEEVADARAAAALVALASRAGGLAHRHPARWLERFVGVDAQWALALAGVGLPIDAAAVRAAAGQIVAALGNGSLSGRELSALERTMAGLLPGEQQALLGALDAGTLARLGGQIGVDDAADPLDRHARLRLMGAIAAAAPRAMLPMLERDFPLLLPTLAGLRPATRAGPRARVRSGSGDRGLTYAEPAAPLLAGDINADDIVQGRLSDCFFLAPLMGLAREHPGLVAGDLRRNPNGTVTVTFFRGGRRLPVTVSPELPYDEGTGVFPFAHLAGPGRPAALWPAVYEKAYAQLDGAYSDLDGGSAAQALRDLTGGPVHRWNPAHHSAAQVRAALAHGDVVTASTSGGRLLGVFGTNPGPLVARHEYLVTAVGADGRVTLRNPWGPAGTRHLTWSQVRSHVAVLTVGVVPSTGRAQYPAPG